MHFYFTTSLPNSPFVYKYKGTILCVHQYIITLASEILKMRDLTCQSYLYIRTPIRQMHVEVHQKLIKELQAVEVTQKTNTRTRPM